MPSLHLGPFVVESYSHGWQIGRPDPVVLEGRRSFVLRDTTYSSTPQKAIRAAIQRILREPDDAPRMERGGEASTILQRLDTLEKIHSTSPDLLALYDALQEAAEEEREEARAERSAKAKGGTDG